MSADVHLKLNEMAARAQRQLDGMTVNRDAVARDVLLLVATVRALRVRARPAQGRSFAAEFDRIFDDLFAKAAPPAAQEVKSDEC